MSPPGLFFKELLRGTLGACGEDTTTSSSHDGDTVPCQRGARAQVTSVGDEPKELTSASRAGIRFANRKRELPRIPFVTADPSTPPEAGSARDASKKGRAGLQASVSAGVTPSSTLPKAGAQPTAERQQKTAGPSTRAEALARDDSGVFWAFARAGERLGELHVNYEQQPEYPLEHIENPKEKLNWHVEKMRLGKDKTSLVYNQFLTLRGIPPETYEYRLGNRSALEWVIDQYQVSTHKRSGITNDPNRADDPEYIVRLIGQVITVSLETMKIVKALPKLEIAAVEDKPGK
jgi:hypothetical protein